MISLRTIPFLGAVGAALIYTGFAPFATCALSAQSVVTLPFSTDFEAHEGYSLGPLPGDGLWQIEAELQSGIVTPGAGSSQALSFLGGGFLDLLIDSGSAPVSWVDFYLKPVFVQSSELPEVIETEQSAVTGFVQVDLQGEVYAVDGDGFGGGSWVPSGELRNLQGNSAADWIRLTYRLDYTTKTWDLFVDGEIVMTDLGFLDQSVSNLSSFSALADGETATLLDYFYAGNDNPLFIDTSNDGLPDAWLTAQGLSIYSDQRSGDSDLDGLNNLLEYRISSQAANPDSDGDGVNDGAEYYAGADPTAADAYSLSALPFIEDFESYNPGPLGAQGNWTVAGETAEIQATEVWAGSAALSLGGDSSASNTLNGSGQSVVWIDLYLKPTAAAESPELVGDTAVGYYFDDEGRPIVFDGSGGNGSGFWKLLDAAKSSDWRRVTVKVDYGAQAYDFYLDGERLGAGLGFAHAQPFISRLRAFGSTTLDDISVNTVEPAELDDDRDGATNAQEIAAGTDPLAFDSDGDGLADSLEILWGLDPAVADATLAQPTEVSPGIHVWTTSFAASEGYTAGALAGQNDWTASGSAVVTAEEEASVSDDPTADAILERMAGMGEMRRVWVSFRAKLVAGELPSFESSPEAFAGAFGAASNSSLAIWDDSADEWTPLPIDADLADWNDFALHYDYVDKVWALCLNGALVADQLPFHDEDLATFSRFKALQAKVEEAGAGFEASRAYFDDIRFANTEPADMDFDADGLLNDDERQLGSDLMLSDTDGDGMDDLWEYQHGLDLLADDSSADPDGDGLQNLDEYTFGRNPLLQDTDGVQGFASLELWHGVQGAYLSNLTDDSRFPLNPDYFTFLEELTTENSPEGLSTYGQRIRGTMTAPVSGAYTFWVSGDARVEFWLSTDRKPFGKELLAELKEATNFQQWTKYASQVSMPVELVEGQSYYFEVLHTEGSGKDHVSVAWQYPGQSRQVVPGEYLTSAVSYVNDMDEDGLPDDWELSVGLDPSKGYGVNGYIGDPDEDSLKNHEERIYGTDPNLEDTDGDGYSDYDEVVVWNTDPNSTDQISWVPIETLAADQYIAHEAFWAVTESGLESLQRKGEFEVPVLIESAGVYRFLLNVSSYSPFASLAGKYLDLRFYIDGEKLHEVHIPATQLSDLANIEVITPYLDVGDHSLTVFWDNVYSQRSILVEGIRLERASFSSPDAMESWIDHRLQQQASVDSIPEFSYVSPVNIEGKSNYANFMSISPASLVKRGASQRWYADVSLSSDSPTPVSIAFENGCYELSGEIKWVALNPFEVSDYTLRLGDSLKLKAIIPDSTAGGTISIDGQSVAMEPGDEIVHTFNETGLVQIVATALDENGEQVTTDLSVNVVGLQMPEVGPALWRYRTRSWVWPDLPENVVLESSLINISDETNVAEGRRMTLSSDDAFSSQSIVARLGEGGPIVGHVEVRPFWLRAMIGLTLVDVWADGTRVISQEVLVDDLPEGVRVKIDIFKSGTVLDDGTRERWLDYTDFSIDGSHRFTIYQSEDSNGAPCHHIYCFEEDQKIGRR